MTDPEPKDQIQHNLSRAMPDLSSSLRSEVVGIDVGEDDDSRRFNIHKDILIAKSGYFEAIFSSNSIWVENESNEVVWSNDVDQLPSEVSMFDLTGCTDNPSG